MYRIILLLLCLYVCNARPLRVINDIESGGRWLQLAGKLSVFELKNTSKLTNEGKRETVDEGKVPTLRSLNAESTGGKDGDTLGRLSEENKGNILPVASAETILETVELKDKRKHARLLRSKPRNNTKESVDCKEDGKEEDIVVMDYAHPHRKPPIHNMTP